jgi:hypothetical protein
MIRHTHRNEHGDTLTHEHNDDVPGHTHRVQQDGYVSWFGGIFDQDENQSSST